MTQVSSRSHLKILLIIAFFAFVAYLPTLTQPFIEDDYHNILLARDYGTFSTEGLTNLMNDEVNRVRATTWWLTSFIEKTFGLKPAAFYAFGILIHILNCFLVYSLGRWPIIGYQSSAWAACFFAIYDGHQEAVMWYSACNELLLFLFGMLTFLCWLKFLDSDFGSWKWYAAALLCFLLALVSKESSVIIVPLLVLPALEQKKDRRWVFLYLPFAVLALIYAIFIYTTRSSSFRFTDGSFSLAAPFWITWTKSFVALFWFWGVPALAALLIWRARLKLIVVSLIWISVSLVPYMFLTYMTRIPSRQVYLASAGLAIIVGAAIAELSNRVSPKRHRLVIASVAIITILGNVGILWTKKRQQYLERSHKTEILIDFARKTEGRIFIECYPRPPIIAETALKVALGKPADTLVWKTEDKENTDGLPSLCVPDN